MPKKSPAKKRPTKAAARPERQPGEKRFWLMKSEPDAFSIDDLAASPDKTTTWDGVRNYQARNFMRDEMLVGDRILFYHSNAKPPGIAGIAKVARLAYPDFTAFDESSKYYDAKSKSSDPTWFMVDVKLVKKFKQEIPLPDLKTYPELDGMLLLQKGQRLSIQPVTEEHFAFIEALSKRK